MAEEELDLFTLNHEQMSYLLRTRTAIGYTGVLFGVAPAGETEVALTIRSTYGGLDSRKIPFAFSSPAERLPKKAVISLDDVQRYFRDAEMKKVFGKSIQLNKVFPTKYGREVRAYCFITSRHVYNQQSEELNLPEDLRIQGGIYVATKGMPTGILLPTPKTGRAG